MRGQRRRRGAPEAAAALRSHQLAPPSADEASASQSDTASSCRSTWLGRRDPPSSRHFCLPAADGGWLASWRTCTGGKATRWGFSPCTWAATCRRGGRGWGGGGQFACCVEHPGRNPLLPPADSLPAPCLPVSRLPAAASHLSGAGQPAVHHLRYIPKLDLPPAGAGGAGLMEKAVYSAAAVVNSTDHHDVHVD